MDKTALELYYRESDPLKRLKYLEKSIAEGEEPEANAVRREIWDNRYCEKVQGEKDRADGFMRLWMELEFCKGASKKLFGFGTSTKTIKKYLQKYKFEEMQEKSPLHKEMLYQECRHLVNLYVDLCEKDKAYNTFLCGLLTIKEEEAREKIIHDVQNIAELPKALSMEKELELISKACMEILKERFED